MHKYILCNNQYFIGQQLNSEKIVQKKIKDIDPNVGLPLQQISIHAVEKINPTVSLKKRICWKIHTGAKHLFIIYFQKDNFYTGEYFQ